MKINEKISRIRSLMKQANISAYIIPSTDPHMSEYIPAYWKGREYVSEFTGSSGTLVITDKASGLWTDGRYYIQAENQIAESEIRLYKVGEKDVPTYTQYLGKVLDKGQCVGLDGRLFSAITIKRMKKVFEEKNIKLVCDIDLLNSIWHNRPALMLTNLYIHDKVYTGLTAYEKIRDVRKVMLQKGIQGYLITDLASIAWLFNIRGNDIPYNPMVIAYAFVTIDNAYLCTYTERIKEETKQILQAQGITLKKYEAIEELINNIKSPMTILCNENQLNYSLYQLLAENNHITISNQADFIMQQKAIKNKVEIENIKKAHIKDGCALVEFTMALEDLLAKGEQLTEYSLVNMLKAARLKQVNNKGESFAPIVAYKENAAMMHYMPNEITSKCLENKGLLLVDSGGQYLEGTTDITRTLALGQTSTEEKLHYTLVLKAHIALAKAVFMKGCTGANLDILARAPLWEKGLDYKCGTGHGVGFFLGVHEGPQSLRMSNHIPLKVGMLLTDEPGIYIQDKHGIRIENILLVVEHIQTINGTFYHFEPVTYFPIDTKPLLIKLLSKEERDWLNNYHKMVYEKLSPYLEGRALNWLREKTVSIE